MSQGAWIKGPVCGVDNCRSRLYRKDAGRKFCQFGHVREGDIEIDDEEGETYTQTKRLNIQISESGHASRSATQSISALSQRSDSRLYGEEGRVYHWACLQKFLRALCFKAIRHLYGYLRRETLDAYTSRVSCVLKLLWMRCVRYCRARKSPLPFDMCAMVYLALRQVNQFPVYLDDFMSMMMNNKVPVINALSVLSPEERRKCPMRTLICLQAKTMPTEDKFIRLIQRWKYRLGLKRCAYPTNDLYPLVFKTFRSLRLPHTPSLLALYHEMCMEITGVFLEMGVLFKSPELQCIGLMFYLLRLYLRDSRYIADPQLLRAWLSEYKSTEFPYTNEGVQSMNLETLLEFSDDEVSRYCDWAYDVFADDSLKNADSEGLNIMVRRLHQIFRYSRASDSQSKETMMEDFASVKNTLTLKEKDEMEESLIAHFVSRFGVSARTLSEWAARAQRDVYQSLKSREMLISLDDLATDSESRDLST